MITWKSIITTIHLQKIFFDIFTEAVYSGTINEEDFDPSGLYWILKRTETANMLLTALNGFSDWMHKEYGAAQLNPWREATGYEQMRNLLSNHPKTQLRELKPT